MNYGDKLRPVRPNGARPAISDGKSIYLRLKPGERLALAPAWPGPAGIYIFLLRRPTAKHGLVPWAGYASN